MNYDIGMTLSLVRGALGNIAKAERMLKQRPPNKQNTEMAIEQGSEELFSAACEVFKSTETFLEFCKNKANIDFLKDLKL